MRTALLSCCDDAKHVARRQPAQCSCGTSCTYSRGSTALHLRCRCWCACCYLWARCVQHEMMQFAAVRPDLLE